MKKNEEEDQNSKRQIDKLYYSQFCFLKEK